MSDEMVRGGWSTYIFFLREYHVNHRHVAFKMLLRMCFYLLLYYGIGEYLILISLLHLFVRDCRQKH